MMTANHVKSLDTPDARPVVLEARNVSWHVRGATLVRGVSLSLHAGEMLGIIGPNGSGKSSFLRLLAGVCTPSAGEVLLEGRSMQRIARRMVARRLALVSQMVDTADAITVQDAVELGRTPWLSALQTWSQRDDDIVSESLSLVDMEEKRAQFWSTLSGGERQRTHIARSLAQQPKILLLDEPTNHLDIHHQLSLMRLIRSLSKSMSIAVAIHDLNHALMCDRLAVMCKGRLVRVDTPDNVLEAALVQEVFEVGVSELFDPKDQARVLRFTPIF